MRIAVHRRARSRHMGVSVDMRRPPGEYPVHTLSRFGSIALIHSLTVARSKPRIGSGSFGFGTERVYGRAGMLRRHEVGDRDDHFQVYSGEVRVGMVESPMRAALLPNLNR
jgi:hypothetical protein